MYVCGTDYSCDFLDFSGNIVAAAAALYDVNLDRPRSDNVRVFRWCITP